MTTARSLLLFLIALPALSQTIISTNGPDIVSIEPSTGATTTLMPNPLVGTARA